MVVIALMELWMDLEYIMEYIMDVQFAPGLHFPTTADVHLSFIAAALKVNTTLLGSLAP